MLNEKQNLIQEKLEDIYRVVKFEGIEEVSVQVTGKKLSRHSFLNNLVTYMTGYCYELIENYQLTSNEDYNVTYVLQTLSSAETDTLDSTVFLLEWAVTKLSLSFGLDPEEVKKVII
ncbi:hypothetical protein BUZ94_06575 [Mammaliicoccus sciuri]|uniref:hypothetical protein n=1 Tax=Mammaliicoccus sciuri TaxID=1296 RepID=UPI000E67D711|nr:hypothetical protein [Mammaliicoccus sciuri]RIO10116.1 hypothetical protein BUZ94_06575 [Mammaliicoccus sciuri]